jgi:hypothetical protein
VILSPDNRTYRIASEYKGDLQMKMSLRFTAGALLALIMQAVCFAQHYKQTNLVSDTSGVAPVTDPQLVNPWGLSRSSSSPWWISDNATGLTTLYNGAGAKWNASPQGFNSVNRFAWDCCSAVYSRDLHARLNKYRSSGASKVRFRRHHRKGGSHE